MILWVDCCIWYSEDWGVLSRSGVPKIQYIPVIIFLCNGSLLWSSVCWVNKWLSRQTNATCNKRQLCASQLDAYAYTLYKNTRTIRSFLIFKNYVRVPYPYVLVIRRCAQSRVLRSSLLASSNHHTTTVLWPFFWDHPGEPVPEENFWTLWCKGRLTEAGTPTIRLGTTSSGLTSAHLRHHHPIFYNPGALPVAQQQYQSTEGN